MTILSNARFQLLNNAKVATATTGTGTMTLGAAQGGAQTEASAGAVNGNMLAYRIDDAGGAWEIGWGLYASSGRTLTRNLDQSSTSSKLVLSGAAIVSIVARQEEITRPEANPSVPLAASFTPENNGGTSLTDGTGSLLLNLHGANAGLETYEQAAPGATPYDVVARIETCMDTSGLTAGIVLRESGSGKGVLWGWTGDNSNASAGLINQTFTSFTSFSGAYNAPVISHPPNWLRFHNDGTNIYAYLSFNGWDWVLVNQVTISSVFTSAPDKMGLCGYPGTGGNFQYAAVTYFGSGLPS